MFLFFPCHLFLICLTPKLRYLRNCFEQYKLEVLPKKIYNNFTN